MAKGEAERVGALHVIKGGDAVEAPLANALLARRTQRILHPSRRHDLHSSRTRDDGRRACIRQHRLDLDLTEAILLVVIILRRGCDDQCRSRRERRRQQQAREGQRGRAHDLWNVRSGVASFVMLPEEKGGLTFSGSRIPTLEVYCSATLTRLTVLLVVGERGE